MEKEEIVNEGVFGIEAKGVLPNTPNPSKEDLDFSLTLRKQRKAIKKKDLNLIRKV
ncbi:hypothetical protein OAC51_03975 [Flavobacteriaceae bacterium]|nr:hypothetical protein [Flavobacteriaceae bacterium]